MTNSELSARYMSDVRSVHEALSRGIIDQIQHDSWIEKLDADLFDKLSFVAEIEDVVSRIEAYSCLQG